MLTVLTHTSSAGAITLSVVLCSSAEATIVVQGVEASAPVPFVDDVAVLVCDHRVHTLLLEVEVVLGGDSAGTPIISATTCSGYIFTPT